MQGSGILWEVFCVSRIRAPVRLSSGVRGLRRLCFALGAEGSFGKLLLEDVPRDSEPSHQEVNPIPFDAHGSVWGLRFRVSLR